MKEKLQIIIDWASSQIWKITLSLGCAAFWAEVFDFGKHLISTVSSGIIAYLIFCRFKNWAQKKEWWDKWFKHS